MIILKSIKVLSVFGTRPEAVKMAPVVKKLRENQYIEDKICVTAQHREMLDQVLDLFDIKPDYDLNIFEHGQSLSQITARALQGIEKVIKDFRPHILLVHGDTSTTFAGALAAFYNNVRVGHVEAGLRSGNIYSPYPEEANRKLVGAISDFHFAPTEKNRQNLLNEGYSDKKIFITGNTGIDSLFYMVSDDCKFDYPLLDNLDFKNNKVIAMTAHRRENIGKPMENIFSAIKDVVIKNKDVVVIYPIHLNPKVREIANKIIGKIERIHLIEPLDLFRFVNLQAKSYMIVTDSGGIQEEAPSLGKPVLVARTETERPEGIKAGTAKLLGVKREDIFNNIDLLLNNEEEYNKMANAVNPYGDGKASKRIVDILLENLK